MNEQELLSDDWLGLLLFPIITCAFYVLAIGLFSRVVPGRIQIIAVEIMEKYRSHLGTFYWFKGAAIASIMRLVPFISPPVSLGFSRLSSQRLNGSRFYKNSHKILYLDEEKNIAIAAEKCWGGGAFLLKSLNLFIGQTLRAECDFVGSPACFHLLFFRNFYPKTASHLRVKLL